MMRMLKIIMGLVLLNPLFINNGYGGKIVKAKYAGEFMSIGVGARALGMGGTFVAISEDVTAGYWNPSALATLEYPQLAGMYAERFASIVNYNYGGIALPYGKNSGISLSFIRLAVDDIPNTTNALIDYGKDGVANTGDEGEGNGIIDEADELTPNEMPRLARHLSDKKKEERKNQLDIFAQQEQKLAKEIEKLDINSLTPIEALNKLNELKKLIREK